LAVPIRDDRGVLGDLWLFKQPHQWFNDQEVRLAQQVANQCAIALRQSRLYQAAQAQVQVLERLNLLKDDFLSTVSHELRSPMANIKMATQVLEISLEPLGILSDETKATYRYFKILKEECQREIELINDLLDLTRLDAGTEPLNLSTIALQVFLPHIAEPLTERTRRQQQQLILDIADNLPPLRTDLSYLERILTELLHNACKYTPAGESITLAAHPIETDVQISVCNSGVEIPTTECDRIFDKFYRIPHNDPWKYGGTGLGLALVKKLVQQINGTIHVESHQGKTCFVMRLPGDIEAFKPFSM
jgi:signal transduction histidine kinase